MNSIFFVGVLNDVDEVLTFDIQQFKSIHKAEIILSDDHKINLQCC